MLIPSENPTEEAPIKDRLVKGFSKMGMLVVIIGFVVGFGIDVIFNTSWFLFPIASLGFVAFLASLTLYLKIYATDTYRRYGKWFILDTIIISGFFVLGVIFSIMGNSVEAISAFLGVGIGSTVGATFYWIVLIMHARSIRKARSMKQTTG